jgi:hypothetical protein
MPGPDLKTTLRRARDDPRYAPGGIGVFICIPLARWRYWLQRKGSEGLLRTLGLYSDFVRQSDRERDWREWWDRHIPGCLEAIAKIRRSGVKVFLNVTSGQFRSSRSQYQLVFLLAHHPESTETIEFRDRCLPWSQVLTYFGAEIAPVLIVCKSGEWREEISHLPLQTGASGGGPWLFPLPEAVEFAAFWIDEIARGSGLLGARERAIAKFFNR